VKIKIVLTSCLVVAAGLWIAVPGAHAHADCVEDAGGDAACVRDNHSRVDACDREPDGHYVRAHYTTQISHPNYYHGPWDSNGSADGCSHVWPNTSVVQYRICEEVAGCSVWAWA